MDTHTQIVTHLILMRTVFPQFTNLFRVSTIHELVPDPIILNKLLLIVLLIHFYRFQMQGWLDKKKTLDLWT